MEIDRKGIKFTFLFLTFLFLSVFFVRKFSGLVFESVLGRDIVYENIDELKEIINPENLHIF